jgi:hypothetical protein
VSFLLFSQLTSNGFETPGAPPPPAPGRSPVLEADSGAKMSASSRAYTWRRSLTSMEERSAKYCDVASLKRALCDSREVSSGESPVLAFVRAWIARPAEWISFATSCERSVSAK